MLASLLVAAAIAASPAPVPPITEAYKVVVEPSGMLLVADGGGGAGRLFRIDPRSGRRSVFAGTGGRIFARGATARKTSLGRVTDVAVARNGTVYAIASSRLVRVDRRGRLTVMARFSAAFGLALAPDGGIYVTDDERGRLLRWHSGRTGVVATGFRQPIGVAVGIDGSVYVTSGHDGARLERIAPGGTRTTVFDDLALQAFVTVVADGSLLVVDHVGHQENGKLLRIAPDGGVTVLSEGVIRAPLSAAQSPSGEIYMTAFGDPAVGRLDVSTGKLLALGRS